jgi:hypothetical protein
VTYEPGFFPLVFVETKKKGNTTLAVSRTFVKEKRMSPTQKNQTPLKEEVPPFPSLPFSEKSSKKENTKIDKNKQEQKKQTT